MRFRKRVAADSPVDMVQEPQVEPKHGPYSGRLSFDPDTCFHTDPEGRKVVTFDAGKTWRYAADGDLSHNARYQERVAVVDTTANKLQELSVQYGIDDAHRLMRDQQPHHYEVQTADAHYSLMAPNLTALQGHTDEQAPTQTSHTEAWS